MVQHRRWDLGESGTKAVNKAVTERARLGDNFCSSPCSMARNLEDAAAEAVLARVLCLCLPQYVSGPTPANVQLGEEGANTSLDADSILKSHKQGVLRVV